MRAVLLDHAGNTEAAALAQRLQFRADARVVPHRYIVLASTFGSGRLKTFKYLMEMLAGLLIVQPGQVVMHQQRGVGGHEIDEGTAERIPHTLSGGKHPRHIVLVDLIEQAQQQAVDADHFDPWLHAGSACSA